MEKNLFYTGVLPRAKLETYVAACLMQLLLLFLPILLNAQLLNLLFLSQHGLPALRNRHWASEEECS